VGREIRRQCEAERTALAVSVVDLEAGLAEQARLLHEATGTLTDRIGRLELELANVAACLRQEHEETMHDRVRRALHHLVRGGV
jgi:hypothetical protein